MRFGQVVRRGMGALLLLTAAIAAPVNVAKAATNEEVTRFVTDNGAKALHAARTARTAEERQRQFASLMDQFADVPRISLFVLGRYGAQVRQNPAQLQEWTRTFRDYSAATYAAHFSDYTGGALKVTGVLTREADRDVVVKSELQAAADPTVIKWRLLRNGQVWKVVDVAVASGDSEIWLAQQQQAQFLALLDKNGGDVADLIAQVRARTAAAAKAGKSG